MLGRKWSKLIFSKNFKCVFFLIIKKYISYLSIGLKIYQPNRFSQCDRNPFSQAADPGGGALTVQTYCSVWRWTGYKNLAIYCPKQGLAFSQIFYMAQSRKLSTLLLIINPENLKFRGFVYRLNGFQTFQW